MFCICSNSINDSMIITSIELKRKRVIAAKCELGLLNSYSPEILYSNIFYALLLKKTFTSVSCNFGNIATLWLHYRYFYAKCSLETFLLRQFRILLLMQDMLLRRDRYPIIPPYSWSRGNFPCESYFSQITTILGKTRSGYFFYSTTLDY